MADMEAHEMKLVSVHDRPLKTELGEYYYIIECSDCTYEDYAAVRKNSRFTFRYLGSFYVF